MLAVENRPKATKYSLDAILPPYATTEQIGDVCRRRPGWVRDVCRREGIAPALTKGRQQFARRDIVRLVVLSKLQELFDARSSVPFELLKAADSAFDELLADPAKGNVLIRYKAPSLTFVVCIPSLKDLVA